MAEHESTPLPYRSKGDAVADDLESMHRSLATWAILCAVWGVGLIVWAGYLGLMGFLVFKVLL